MGICDYDGAMITVIIETRDDEVRLAHLLATLVSAATEGVVRDVVVIDYGSTDGTLVVADAAGCGIVMASRAADGRKLAADQARGDWLLFMSPRTSLGPDWQREAFAFIDRVTLSGKGRLAFGRLWRGHVASGWRRWLLEFTDRVLATSRDDGLLVQKGAWLAASLPVSAASSASSVSGVRRGAA
jgi:hypothetical protein